LRANLSTGETSSKSSLLADDEWAGTPYRRSKYLNSGKRSEPGQWLLEKYRSRGRAAVRLWLSIIIIIIIIIIIMMIIIKNIK
jgi:hypothetical protein